MGIKKVSVGQMWKSLDSGEIYVVTSLYKDVLVSYASLRAVDQQPSSQNKRTKVVRTDEGESLAGYAPAEQV